MGHPEADRDRSPAQKDSRRQVSELPTVIDPRDKLGPRQGAPELILKADAGLMGRNDYRAFSDGRFLPMQSGLVPSNCR
jgi:hypothetical protein